MHINLLYRPSQTLAQCRLGPEESVVAESGAMVGMTTNVGMTTQSSGLMGGLKRLFGGESFFRNTFTARGGEGEVLLASPLCGDMSVIDVGQSQWLMQNSAYVASSPTVDVKTKSGGYRGIFSGAGAFVLETQGQGQLILGSFGALEPIHVDGRMIIDTGHLAAWQSSLSYKIAKSGAGWFSSWLSGEGVVCEFEGHGVVLMQTRNAQEYGRAMGALLPPRQG